MSRAVVGSAEAGQVVQRVASAFGARLEVVQVEPARVLTARHLAAALVAQQHGAAQSGGNGLRGAPPDEWGGNRGSCADDGSSSGGSSSSSGGSRSSSSSSSSLGGDSAGAVDAHVGVFAFGRGRLVGGALRLGGVVRLSGRRESGRRSGMRRAASGRSPTTSSGSDGGGNGARWSGGEAHRSGLGRQEGSPAPDPARH